MTEQGRARRSQSRENTEAGSSWHSPLRAQHGDISLSPELRQLGQEEAHLPGRGSTGWKTTQPRGILCFFVWLRVPAPASRAGAGKPFRSAGSRVGFGWALLPGDPCELLKAQTENKHRLTPLRMEQLRWEVHRSKCSYEKCSQTRLEATNPQLLTQRSSPALLL